jgi:chorismate mutase
VTSWFPDRSFETVSLAPHERGSDAGNPGAAMTVRAARGAIRVESDTKELVLAATERLLGEVLKRNELDVEQLVSVFFTSTPDLRSVFPAEAARRMGLTAVPLLCGSEIPVEGAMPSVIRVLVHFQSERALRDVEHVYLDGAEALRDDL